MATFGSRLRALRARANMTQEDMGKIFGLSKSAVGMYERDEREPTIELLKRFAEYFGCSVDYLVGRSDDKQPEHRPVIDQDMTLREYTLLAMRTAGHGNEMEFILNGAMGLAGESGEVIDHLKKHLFQGHPLDRDKLVDELGDVLWYVACTAFGLGHTLDYIAKRNIEKLEKRYPKGHFDVEDSIRRADVGTNEGKNE